MLGGLSPVLVMQAGDWAGDLVSAMCIDTVESAVMFDARWSRAKCRCPEQSGEAPCACCPSPVARAGAQTVPVLPMRGCCRRAHRGAAGAVPGGLTSCLSRGMTAGERLCNRSGIDQPMAGTAGESSREWVRQRKVALAHRQVPNVAIDSKAHRYGWGHRAGGRWLQVVARTKYAYMRAVSR